MSQTDILEYLSQVQKLYVEGESREMVFSYFLQNLLDITKSRIGFIAELLKKPDGHYYFHTVAETKMPNLYQTYINITDFSNLLHHDAGYCLNATDGNMFGQLVKQKKPIIVTDPKHFDNSKYPKGHPTIETFLGIPFFYESKMVGAIVLCNSYHKYTWELVEKLKPVQYICSILLTGFKNRSLKDIYKTFVNKIHMPVVLFQSNKSIVIDEDHFDISPFVCITLNKAFEKLQHKTVDDTDTLSEVVRNIKGDDFFQCFPNMIDEPKITSAIKKMFQNKIVTSVDMLDYYDMNVPQDIYTFRFVYIDNTTFAVWIESISDQLKAKKVVQELAKSNEEFFAKIIHEFRNPLNAIINVIALMNDSSLVRENTDTAKDFRHKLQLLSTSCVTLATLSQDITDYAQLKTKKLKLSYQPFDLSKCIDFSIGMMNYEAQKKGLSIRKNINTNVPLCIVSDPKRLRQVLINLCSNAVKFTERGHIGIHCELKKRAYPDDDDENYHSDEIYDIQFEIEDTGRGIDENELKMLFKPFKQLRPKTDQFKGTGLGLVICKYLVQLLGGEMWVESEKGRGTKFYFTIKGKRCSMDIIEKKYLPSIENKKCLLADPIKSSRLAALRCLLNWNVKVTACDNIDEAVLYLDSNRYDIIISDRKWNRIFEDYENVAYMSRSSHDLNRPIEKEKLLQHIIKFIDENIYVTKNNEDSPIKRPLTILLAEDNYINRQVELESLHQLGFQDVDVAEDGQQAIDLMKEFTYDVLLLDLKMPNVDGYQTFEYLLEHPEIKPYTIALTGNAIDRDRKRCLDMGMDEYLTKPIDMHLLKTLLEKKRSEKQHNTTK
jgi:signal transduction histidine kinase/CheY-like chemotaxis protein